MRAIKPYAYFKEIRRQTIKKNPRLAKSGYQLLTTLLGFVSAIKVGLSSHHSLRRVLLVGGQSKELRIWYGGEGLFFQKIVRRSTNLLYI